MDFLQKVKDFKLLSTAISLIVVFTVTGFTTYTDIYKTMDTQDSNLKKEYKDSLYQLELTQKSLLKAQIRDMELYPCKTSRDEWADYNIIFSQYNTLNKKHNPLLKEMNNLPMERLKEDSCKCYKGGNCNE